MPRLLLAAALLLPASVRAEDAVFADFEGDTHAPWTATGEAFGAGPAAGALPGQMAVEGFAGKRLINSFHGGDGAKGTLTSPEFTVSQPYVAFLIGGGGFEGKTCLNLEVDGHVVRTATGPNTQPGGSERLTPQGWDVREFVGKKARFVIVDEATGGWGHVNVDGIRFTDVKPPMWLTDATRELTAEKPWLHFPIRTGGPKRKVTLTLDGQAQPALDMELADGGAEWWAPFDLTPWKGKKVKISVDRLPEESKGLSAISQDDAIRAAVPVYAEKLRPQFHFSARRGWLNDPNGLVFHEGTWHLFFQHNPYGWNWGNMHWGHATSRDLFRWQEQGDKIFPDADGPAFSGSGVVDWRNTSGLGADGKPPLCFFYTAAGSPTVQKLVFSTDGGRTLRPFEGNPIIGQVTPGNRDPKVIWHPQTGRWVLVLYVEKGGKHVIEFHTSSDLKKWERTSEVDGFFECPDLFPLSVDGQPAKWVLTAASSEYVVGDFDGRVFKPLTPKLPGHRGKGFYAAQTYSDAPDDRRVQIGWLQAPSPGMPFNQCMSVPLELALRGTADGPRLTMWPVKELDALHAGTQTWDAATVQATVGETLDLSVTLEPGQGTKLALSVRGASISWDAAAQELAVNGQKAPAPLMNGRQTLRVLVDRTTIEVFASEGLTYVPQPFIPQENARELTVTTSGDAPKSLRTTAHSVLPVWPK